MRQSVREPCNWQDSLSIGILLVPVMCMFLHSGFVLLRIKKAST